MAVPNQVPKSEKDLTDGMRRKRALDKVQTNLKAAVKRLEAFLPGKSRDDIIRQVHTAKTEIVNDSDETEIVDYYTLWTDFADMRLATGPYNLLRNNDPIQDKLRQTADEGFDTSEVITTHELVTNTTEYTTARLASLALQLERFLPAEAK